MRSSTAAVALALAGLLGAGQAVAQDPGRYGPPVNPLRQEEAPPTKKDEDEKQKAEARKVKAELDGIAAQFRDKQTKALMKRVPAKNSIYLVLGTKKGTFKHKQAEGVLKEWFGKVVNLKLATDSAKHAGMTGTYDLVYRTTKDARTHRDKKLYVTIKKTRTGFSLKQLRVE